jgi:hypothetical protein
MIWTGEVIIPLYTQSLQGECKNHEVEIGASYCAPISGGGERSAERFINLILDSDKVHFRHRNTFAEVIFNCWGFNDARPLQNGKKGKVL